MHVLFTADTLGGVWTYARELVTGLHARGHRVTLVSFGDIPTAEQSGWLASLPRVDFRPTAFRLEWMQDVERDLEASAEYLLAVIREVKPDLLHFNQFYYGDLDCDLPRLVVAHSDVVTWWLAVNGKEPPESAWMRGYRRSVARAVNRADAIVAPSNWMLSEFQSAHGPARSAYAIYNGRTPSLFNPYAPKKPYALSAGRVWDLGKNSVLLSRIGPPLPIYLVGNDKDPSSGPDGPFMHDSSSLTFKGPQDEKQMQELYAAAHIYVATSQYEPFGLAPLEAAFSRCALVVSDIPSLREIWGSSAIYFASNDALDLQRALESLVAEPGRINAMAGRAYRHAVARYQSSKMVDSYLKLYATLVGEEVAVA